MEFKRLRIKVYFSPVSTAACINSVREARGTKQAQYLTSEPKHRCNEENIHKVSSQQHRT